MAAAGVVAVVVLVVAVVVVVVEVVSVAGLQPTTRVSVASSVNKANNFIVRCLWFYMLGHTCSRRSALAPEFTINQSLAKHLFQPKLPSRVVYGLFTP